MPSLANMLALLLVFVFCSHRAFAAEPAKPQEPDLSAALRQAQATQQSMLHETCHWTCTIVLLNSGAVLTAEWTRSPTAVRRDLFVKSGTHRQLMASVIERDGFWYVNDGGQSFGKYQPFEAPFDLPTLPLFYQFSTLQPLATDHIDGTFESFTGDVATYRTPLNSPARLQLQTMLKEIDEHPQIPTAPGLVTSLKDLVNNGMTFAIDTDTGFITRRVNPKFNISWSALTWSPATDDKPFDLAGHDWIDHSAGPESVDPNDLVMLWHVGNWRPGSKGGDMDAQLVDITTGNTWRVPFTGPISVPGCFSRDRKSVIVTGMDVETGGLTMYRVDLRTRENHRIGEGPALEGQNMMPALSHDGKMLAFTHHAPDQKMLYESLYLVDLTTNKGKILGQPMDTAFLSWLPDDSGIALLEREPGPGDQVAKTDVATLDLKGKLTTLCPGDSPLVIGNDRILFEDRSQNDNRVWKTCRLDGSDIKLLGDGLTGYGFPAVSPDSQHLMLIRYDPTQATAPTPTIFDMDGSHPKPLKLGPGLWTTPVW